MANNRSYRDEYFLDEEEYSGNEYSEYAEEYDPNAEYAFEDYAEEAFPDEEYIEEPPAPRRAAPKTQRREAAEKPAAPKKEKSGRKWRRFILIYTIVVLLIGAAGLTVLYKFLDAYEQGLPDHTMEAYLAGKTEDDWLAAMLASPTLSVTEFENSEEIIRAYFDASCRGSTFTFREAAGVSSKEAPVFTVKAGAADVCRVYLRPTEPLGFGRSLWEVERCEAYISPYSLSSATVEIEAPSDESVCLNGTALSSAYIVEDHIPCTDLGSLESRYEEQPYRVRYEVSGLYGDITVTGADGAVISPESSGESIVYTLGGNGYSFTVKAPADVTVSVCGTALTQEEEVSRDNGLLTGLEAWVQADSGSVTYAADGLYRRPEITADPPAGRSLLQTEGSDGSVIFSYAGDETLAEEYESVVRNYFDTFMYYSAGRDAAFLSLLSATLPNTELYSYIQNSTAAMYWASNTQVDYEYLNFENFLAWSDDCFSCRVSYKAHITAESWYEVRESDLENIYDMVFVRQADVWYAAVMNFAE